MKKKMISILLAGAMAAGMLAGCGDSGEKTGDGNGQQAAEEAGAEEANQGGQDEGGGEVKTIHMYTMGIGNTTDYKLVQDAINDISREKIGVEVDWTVLDIGQWFEQYNQIGRAHV